MKLFVKIFIHKIPLLKYDFYDTDNIYDGFYNDVKQLALMSGLMNEKQFHYINNNEIIDLLYDECYDIVQDIIYDKISNELFDDIIWYLLGGYANIKIKNQKLINKYGNIAEYEIDIDMDIQKYNNIDNQNIDMDELYDDILDNPINNIHQYLYYLINKPNAMQKIIFTQLENLINYKITTKDIIKIGLYK
jgi:hypothetical protein